MAKSGSVKIFSQVWITSNEMDQIAKAISGRINRDKNAWMSTTLLIQDLDIEIIHKLNTMIVREAAASNRACQSV